MANILLFVKKIKVKRYLSIRKPTINCDVVFVFKAPGPFSGEYNAFIMERVFHGFFDETVCIDWSSNSKILAVGSKDMSAKLYVMER